MASICNDERRRHRPGVDGQRCPPCEECEGKRLQASVLQYHLGRRDISEVLAMPVTEVWEFFSAGEARTPSSTGSSTPASPS
jgi:hypothetical protein